MSRSPAGARARSRRPPAAARRQVERLAGDRPLPDGGHVGHAAAGRRRPRDGARGRSRRRRSTPERRASRRLLADRGDQRVRSAAAAVRQRADLPSAVLAEGDQGEVDQGVLGHCHLHGSPCFSGARTAAEAPASHRGRDPARAAGGSGRWRRGGAEPGTRLWSHAHPRRRPPADRPQADRPARRAHRLADLPAAGRRAGDPARLRGDPRRAHRAGRDHHPGRADHRASGWRHRSRWWCRSCGPGWACSTGWCGCCRRRRWGSSG